MQAYEYVDDGQCKHSPDTVSNLEKLLSQIANIEATIFQDTPNDRLRLKESKTHDINVLNTTQKGCNQSNCCQESDHAMQETDGDFTKENEQGRCDNCKESSCRNESLLTKKIENTRSEDVGDDLRNIDEGLTNILGELKLSLRDHDVRIGSNTMLDQIINNS